MVKFAVNSWVLLVATILTAAPDQIYAKKDDRECLRMADGSCDEDTVVNDEPQRKVVSFSQPPCNDLSEHCYYWAMIGECEKNPYFMTKKCSKSCQQCPALEEPEFDNIDLELGEDLGVSQSLSSLPTVTEDDVKKVIQQAREYMSEDAQTSLPAHVLDVCRNHNEHCAAWAADGLCETHMEFMSNQCGPVCGTCQKFLSEYRCKLDPNAKHAWEAGDLEKTFAKLTSEPYRSQYAVEILSSPATTGGPWVITMEDLISEEEANHLIELGGQLGYTRSKGTGVVTKEGDLQEILIQSRTSSNTWCMHSCHTNSTYQAVMGRISDMIGIDEKHSEYLQLLKYEKGQFYETHHDYIDNQRHRPAGARLLTVYMYLNDVEAGGGTKFDKLDVTVMPKRGRAVIWPSVQDASPEDRDVRTYHQALPVEEGTKYGANAWFHIRDFKTPHMNGCA